MSRSRAATGPYRPLYCWIGCAANNTDLYARAATERARARKMHRSTRTSFRIAPPPHLGYSRFYCEYRPAGLVARPARYRIDAGPCFMIFGLSLVR